MKLISSLVFMYVGILNEVSRKLTKNVYFLSQVQEASHHELTNLSFNYLSSQHLVSTPTTTIFLSQPPTITHKKKKKKEKKKKKKKKAKQHQNCKPQTTCSTKSPTCQPVIIPPPTCFLLAPALKPQIVLDPAKKKTPHTHTKKKKKKKKLKIQFLHQAQGKSCLAYIKASILKNNEQCQSMLTIC